MGSSGQEMARLGQQGAVERERNMLSARNTQGAEPSATDDGVQGGDEGEEGGKMAQAPDWYNGVGRSSGNWIY